jgi:hypothetical protein
MAEVDVPLFSGVYKNVDQSVLTDKNFRMVDAILDQQPSIFSRPGLSTFLSTGVNASIDGEFWWDDQQMLIVVCGGNIYYTTNFTSFTATTGTLLNLGVKVSIVSDGTYVYFANGGQIVRWNSGISPAYLTDTDAPLAVTHLVLLDSYLIANKVGSATFYFTTPGDASTWSALDFASAESEPDDVNSLVRFRSEAYLFGRESFEIWEDDGQTPFARVNGGSFNVGCIAPYSVVALDNTILWLSNTRQFVKFSGGGVENFETKFDKELSAFTTVADCETSVYYVAGKTLVVFQFPGEGRTIVYNETDDNWGEFGYWDSVAGDYQCFLGRGCTIDPDRNRVFVGSRKATGKVYLMSPSYFTDDGDPLRGILVSGSMDYGTHKEKINMFFSMRVKRGSITDSSEPVMTLRFKDNGEEWSNEIQISLGLMGDGYNEIREHRLGRYTNRQYEFTFSDAVGLVFSNAKEEIVVAPR